MQEECRCLRASHAHKKVWADSGEEDSNRLRRGQCVVMSYTEVAVLYRLSRDAALCPNSFKAAVGRRHGCLGLGCTTTSWTYKLKDMAKP